MQIELDETIYSPSIFIKILEGYKKIDGISKYDLRNLGFNNSFLKRENFLENLCQ